jgi:HflK protein
MDRNIQRIGLLNLIALLAAGGATEMVARYANSASGQVGAILIGLGFLVAVVSYFQMRLEARERLEKLEYEELKKAPAGTALFSDVADTFPARRAREQFERFFAPVFAILLFLLQSGAVYWLWGWLGKVTPPQQAQATIAMALAAPFALALFLLGKYVAALARLERQRLLRPGASYLLLGALVGFLVAISEAAAWFGFPKVDFYVAGALGVMLGLVAIETLVNLVLEIYRPRLKGKEARLLYESRLLGLLSQPGGLITTAAQALDYQFGFQVSQTWFYRFLERALAWLVLMQLGALLASTTLVIIEPSEQGLLERFGRPVASRAVLEPGPHFKWPWPIDKVYRYGTREIRSFNIGFIADPELDKENTMLWTRPHFKEEFNLLVASREAAGAFSNSISGEQAVPVNLLSVNVPVQYQITNLHAWAYHQAEPAQLLEKLATREVVNYLVSVDIDDIMTTGRLSATHDLRTNIQARVNAAGLGVEILFVGLQGIHPPVKVADAYEAVIGSLQEKETNILEAEAYALATLPKAYAQATNRVNQAQGDKAVRVASALAQSERFTNQLAAYRASPSVFSQRAYLDTLSRAVSHTRKLILAATNTQDIVILNLEDKVRQDLLDASLPSTNR